MMVECVKQKNFLNRLNKFDKIFINSKFGMRVRIKQMLIKPSGHVHPSDYFSRSHILLYTLLLPFWISIQTFFFTSLFFLLFFSLFTPLPPSPALSLFLRQLGNFFSFFSNNSAISGVILASSLVFNSCTLSSFMLSRTASIKSLQC